MAAKTAKKKKTAATLTPKQLRDLLLTKCKTRGELMNLIKFFFGLELPNGLVSRHADTTPFDVVWEMYDICVNKHNPDDIKELLYVAARGSGKCVKKDTVIQTLVGPKYIQNVKPGDIVWTGWSWKPVLEFFDEGIKNGVSITTKHISKSGTWNLTGSLRHRVQALTVDGKIDWVRMAELTPGQLIYRSNKRPVHIDSNSANYWDGWLIGVLVGDGAINRHQSNNIRLCSSDFELLRKYSDLVYDKFGIQQSVRRNSKKSVNLSVSNKAFKDWFSGYVDGELSYFKKLRTLEHSVDFLAGFIAGMMDTDGSKESITLANPVLVEQLSQILSILGIHSSINKRRRKPSATKFVAGHIVEYYSLEYKTPLYEPLLPRFSKKAKFIEFANKMNEQYRYPSVLLTKFAEDIKTKYEIANGYWRLQPGKKTHSKIKYASDLWGVGPNSIEKYVYGYKIDYFIDLAKQLDEHKWAEYLTFIRNGHYEVIDDVKFEQAYFYDLEVADDHAYWSNGFISHNTLGVAIAELLILLQDQRDTVHLGAILSQAKRCYAYQQKFLLGPKMKAALTDPNNLLPNIIEKMNMEKTIFDFDGEKVTMEVLPTTLKAVNGPHVPLVVCDELDTLSGESLKAFKDISGMLDSRGDKKALRVGISTRKSRYGLMNQSMENAEKEGRTVRRWTVLEFSQRCPDNRSGTTKTLGYYNKDTLVTLSEAEWKAKDSVAQNEYLPHEFPGEKCLKCPIAALCLGDAKNQTSKSPMLKPIDDAIKKAIESGPDWAISQLFNLKPSVEGIIYKEFEERTHVKNWNQMWRTLTNTDFPGECTHDIFVKKCRQMKLQCYAGIDWGWSNPSTCVVFYVDNQENVYVVRTDARTYYNNPSWITHIKNTWHSTYGIHLYFPDLANPGDGQLLREAGLICPEKVDKNVNDGIQVVKKWLRSLGNPLPKIFVAKETNQFLIDEFGMYHFQTDAAGAITDTPDTENDHALDALRYAMLAIFGKSRMISAGDGLDISNEMPIDAAGNFTRVPTAAEYAQQFGLTINDDPNAAKNLGKVGTLSQLAQIDNEDEDVGSGSFLWSF